MNKAINTLRQTLNITKFANKYEEHFALATNELTQQDFWAEQAKLIDWYKQPEQILDKSNPPFYKWFKGGQLNTSYNCIDRHAAQDPSRNAIIWESAMENKTKYYTYAETQEQVSRFAGVLRNHGVGKGDRVIIYMPMVPEALFAIYACSRIGAVHSIVFGGFGGPELASRIRDADPKVIVSASCGLEPGKVVDYKDSLDEAVELSGRQVSKIIFQREMHKVELKKGQDYDYYDELAKAQLVDPVPVDATDYLYVLYTSGTTGTPKGVVRDNGGNAVALSYTMKYLFDIGPKDVYFSSSDIGWVVGHSYIIYGPMMAGATTILFEGKPVGTPDAGVIWRLCEKHNVRGLYSSPTAVRSMRREDPEGEHIRNADLSNLNAISMAGERVDIPAYNWLLKNLPGSCVVNDNYWQTETGWSIGSNGLKLHTFPSKPGSTTKPAPGMNVEIMDEFGKACERGQLGKVCVKLPMPPSFMPTLWGNDEAFVEKYLKDVPGYYFTGDAGFFDEDGYLHVGSRVDDIINTAGHRLSTSQMEEVLTHHPDISEAAVVGANDEIKGEIPCGFVVLKKGIERDHNSLESECIQRVRHEIGPVASFKKCIAVDKLPKTRSGKILRNVLRSLVNGEQPKIPPTIEDKNAVNEIIDHVIDHGLGHAVDLKYEQI